MKYSYIGGHLKIRIKLYYFVAPVVTLLFCGRKYPATNITIK